MSRYSKQVPTLISNTVSNADELSRWILDLNGIQYIDERHAPGLHIGPSNEAAGIDDGIANNPVLVATDAVASGKDGVFEYMESRCDPDRRLYPEDPDRRRQAQELFHYFWDELWRPVGRYVYAKILPHKKCTAPMMTAGVPLSEKLIVWTAYWYLSMQIAKGLKLDEHPPQGELEKIERVFARVEDLLSDGRPYLTGETLTVADLMFATNSAPVILPPEFRGSAADIETVPDDLRRQILEFRETTAGQFVSRIFAEHRPPLCDQGTLPREPGLLSRALSSIGNVFFGRRFRIWLFGHANETMPIIKLGKRVFVNDHALVTDILDRDEDFTIEEINKDKMAKLSVPFFLGMDRSEVHDRELAMAKSVVRPGDGERIREFVRRTAKEQIDLAQKFGRIDVVASLAEVVMVRLLGDYFGVRGPTEAAMKRWMRILFWDLFLNLSDDAEVHRRALEAAGELKDHLEQLIAERKRALEANPGAVADTLLDRMIRKQHEPGHEWLDDDAVRRNISGLIIGALPTNSTAMVLVLDELLHRPQEIRRAAEAAAGGDVEAVHHYAYEALRFNPHNSIIFRYAKQAQTVERPGDGPYEIEADSKLYLGLSAAMFDPRHFPRSGEFDIGRDLKSYMHFGYGFHECFGSYINAITIPEMTAAILRLKGLKRAPGRAGKGLYEGPFPNNFLVTFDAT